MRNSVEIVEIIELKTKNELINYIDTFAKKINFKDHREAFEALDNGELEGSFAAIELECFRLHLMKMSE